MKKILTLTTSFGLCAVALAQNGVSGPNGLYGNMYAAATTINNGGTVTVGNGGNWVLGGNITSADKTNSNTASTTGTNAIGEYITFSGSGTYQIGSAGTAGTPLAAGTSGAVVDGYVATTATTTLTVLPTGNATASYPITVPATTATLVAYYDGSGSASSNVTVTDANGNALSGSDKATVFSQYYDFPNKGAVAGNYAVSYPSGLTSGNNAILFSNDAGSTYRLGANLASPISTSAGTTALTNLPDPARFYLSTSTVILPVDFIGFTATAQGTKVLLDWQVGTEQNVNNYLVQRSADGTNWQKIATVAATGSSSYNSSDASPLSGVSYYRIVETDKDGKQTISIMRQVSFGPAVSINVWPNPVTTKVYVTGSAAELSRVRVLDNLGRVLKAAGSSSNSATNVTLDLSGMARGIYYLQTLTTTTKLIKQ